MAKPTGFAAGFGTGFGVGRYRYSLAPWVWNAGGNGLNYWRLPDSSVGGVDLRNLSSQAIAGGAAQGFCFTASMQPVNGNEIADCLDFRDEAATPTMQDGWQSSLGYRPQGAKLVDLLWDQLTNGADPSGQNGPLPLMPTIAGVLELRMGGHSVVKSERFIWGAHPHTGRVRDVLRREFRQHHERDPDHARRVLDYWCRQHRTDWREFVPRDLLPHVPGPLPHATTLTDDFNRADGTTIGDQLTWTEYKDNATADSWSTVSNVARATSVGASGLQSARAESDLSSSNNYGQCSIVTLGSGSQNVQLGATARHSSSDATYYGCRLLQINDQFQLVKSVAGTLTQLGSSFATTPAPPQTAKTEANGSSIAAYLDGVSRASATDTAIASGTRCGICGYTESTNIGEVDSFTAADLAAAGAQPSYLSLLGVG